MTNNPNAPFITPSRNITRRVLHAYHQQVWCLLDYLVELYQTMKRSQDECLPSSSIECLLLKDDDSPEYRSLLTASFVAPDDGAHQSEGKRNLNFSTASMYISEVIDLAQAKLFARGNGKPSNVITSGYRSADPGRKSAKRGGQRSGITNYFVNTVITALQAPEWKLLLKRVGEGVMMHLLSETSIYIALPNDCFCQVTGTPLLHIPTSDLRFQNFPPHISTKGTDERCQLSNKRAASDNLDERPSKRNKTGEPDTAPVPREFSTHSEPTPSGPLKKRSIADVSFARASMFYSRPVTLSRTKLVLVGLPSNHVLNRMTGLLWREERKLSSDLSSSKDDEYISRHLLKHIFPLQFKLDNAFQSESNYQERFQRNVYANRDAEIKRRGPCNTPRRLKRTLFLASKIFRSHLHCGYKPLLDKLCPSKVRNKSSDQLDSSVILEMISEQSIDVEAHLATQASFLSNVGSMADISAHGLSLANAQAKLKPKFAEFTCSHNEVFLFARLITKEVIPHVFWGSDHNFNIIMKNVKLLISNRRFEGLSLHSVLQGYKTDDCSWVLPDGKAMGRCSSPSEPLKRRELLEEFIFWYFDLFLIPLLKTTFYVTDSSAFRNKVLYFRQDDWDVLCKPLLERLASGHFERITQHEAEELLRHRRLGFSFVRLLPKDTGVRPIVNLRRKRAQIGSGFEKPKSINQILQAAFEILSYEKGVQRNRLGASVFGHDETYLKLKKYKQSICDSSGRLPKLYFVKVDVQACFDTIEQKKLLEILKDIISQDTYMIQRYGMIVPSSGKITRRYEKKALPDDEHPHFLTVAAKLASLVRHSIFVDQVVYPFAYRDDIIELLEEHITSNIVKINNDYYRQSVGIPQGSILSSILCSFFYGDLEKSSLKFTDSRNSVLLRLIDDYLFITTSLDDAQRFLSEMKKGHPEYGCFISRDKTLTNFDHGDINSSIRLSGVLRSDSKEFSWCGLFINTEDLSISVDYSRFHEDYLRDSLTVQKNKHMGKNFVQKMLQNARNKSHIIFSDAFLNSPDVVYANIYQALIVTAMKMHAYLKSPGIAILAQSRRISKRLRTGKSTGVAKGQETLADGNSRRTEATFLLNTINQCIDYAYASVVNKSKGWVARQGDAVVRLKRDEVKWLGIHAFLSIMSLKCTTYARVGVLQILKRELQLRKLRVKSSANRLSKLADRNLKLMLETIKF